MFQADINESALIQLNSPLMKDDSRTKTPKKAVFGILFVVVLAGICAVHVGRKQAMESSFLMASSSEIVAAQDNLGSGTGSTPNIEMIGTNFATLKTEIATKGCPFIVRVTNQGVYTAGVSIFEKASECIVTSSSITVTATGVDRMVLWIVEVSVGTSGLATVKSNKFNVITGAAMGAGNLPNPSPTYPHHNVYYAAFKTVSATAPTTNVEAIQQWGNLFKNVGQIGFEASNGDLTIFPSTGLYTGGNGFVQFNHANFQVQGRKVDGSGLAMRVHIGSYNGGSIMQCVVVSYTSSGVGTAHPVIGNGWGLTNDNMVWMSGTPKCKIGDLKFYVGA